VVHQPFDHTGPKGISMNLTGQFNQVSVIFDNKTLESALKQMS
jgi:hypothetical protein